MTDLCKKNKTSTAVFSLHFFHFNFWCKFQVSSWKILSYWTMYEKGHLLLLLLLVGLSISPSDYTVQTLEPKCSGTQSLNNITNQPTNFCIYRAPKELKKSFLLRHTVRSDQFSLSNFQYFIFWQWSIKVLKNNFF